jgi:hypothetical protein
LAVAAEDATVVAVRAAVHVDLAGTGIVDVARASKYLFL